MRALTVLLSVLILARCTPAPERTYFLTTLGEDTLVAERIVREGARFEGFMLHRVPRTARYEYAGSLDAEGRVASVSGRIEYPGDTLVPGVQFDLTFRDTLVLSTWESDGVADTVHLTVQPGASPVILQSFALYEQLTRQAAAIGRDTVPVDLVGVASGRITKNAIVREDRDSVSLTFFGNPLMLAVDATGRLQGADGGHTTQQTVTTKLASIDLDQVQASFVAAETRGWSLSRRDTTVTTVAGAELWVDYGRPQRRGRQVFGQLVPWDEVWRTGANAATQFRTSHDLRVGETVVPAGFYTLWTLPTDTSATLIVNRQTGQWGTGYDPAEDLVRLPLEVQTLDAPVERFTIAVEETGPKAGVLSLTWDRSRWTLPFTVR